ncbi:MAG: hypothetical protein Q7U51_03410 [Methanoregula sp.]|nr:hypothetical protein [Methanoregula sp.]
MRWHAETFLEHPVKVRVPVAGPDGDERDAAPFGDHRVAPVYCTDDAGGTRGDEVDVCFCNPALVGKLLNKVFWDVIGNPPECSADGFLVGGAGPEGK